MQRSLITERKSGQRCWVVIYPALLLHFLVGQLQQFVAIGIRSSVLGALLNLPLSTALTLGGSCMPPVQGLQRFRLPLGWKGVWWTTQSIWPSSSLLPVSLRLLLPCRPGRCGLGQMCLGRWRPSLRCDHQVIFRRTCRFPLTLGWPISWRTPRIF